MVQSLISSHVSENYNLIIFMIPGAAIFNCSLKVTVSQFTEVLTSVWDFCISTVFFLSSDITKLKLNNYLGQRLPKKNNCFWEICQYFKVRFTILLCKWVYIFIIYYAHGVYVLAAATSC